MLQKSKKEKKIKQNKKFLIKCRKSGKNSHRAKLYSKLS